MPVKLVKCKLCGKKVEYGLDTVQSGNGYICKSCYWGTEHVSRQASLDEFIDEVKKE